MEKTFQDRFGRTIRLTEERAAHILEHGEMKGELGKIEEVLREPDVIIHSQRDPTQ